MFDVPGPGVFAAVSYAIDALGSDGLRGVGERESHLMIGGEG